MKHTSRLLAAGLAAFAFVPCSLAVVIDTNPSNNSIGTFASSGTQTYGQTFTVPAVDNQLTSFALTLSTTTGTVNFNFGIMAWDSANSRVTGSVLFSQGFSNTGVNTLTIAPNLSLTSGNQYVAFISTLGVANPVTNSSRLNSSTGNPYSGGGFVYINDAGPFSNLSIVPWSAGFTDDVAFRAVFTPGATVPDGGSSLALLSAAMLGLLACRRRLTALS